MIKLGRRKKASSRKSKQEMNDLYAQSFEALQGAIKNINQKLLNGKSVSDEEIRLLKKSPQIIQSFQHRELGQEKEEEILPEGKLKQWVENHFRLTKLVFGEDNKRSKLTKEKWDSIADEMGYFRCVGCGDLHIKGRKCLFVEYAEKISKSNVNKSVTDNSN